MHADIIYTPNNIKYTQCFPMSTQGSKHMEIVALCQWILCLFIILFHDNKFIFNKFNKNHRAYLINVFTNVVFMGALYLAAQKINHTHLLWRGMSVLSNQSSLGTRGIQNYFPNTWLLNVIYHRHSVSVVIHVFAQSISPYTRALARQLLGLRAVSPRVPRYLCLGPSARGFLALK